MQPLTPLEERDRHYLDRDTTPGWGALLALLIVAALVVMAIFAFGGVGGELEDPTLPAPTEDLVEPGS